MKRFEWVEATSLEKAAELTAETGAVIRAGGVDLMDLQKEHLLEPDRVVSIRRVEGARAISEEGGSIRIGALATLADIARHPAILARARAVAVSAGEAASPQIRNQATAAGNLLQRPRCWYFRKEECLCARKGGPECLALEGENQYHAIFGNTSCAIVHPSNLAPALMLFDATVRTIRADGTRREIAVADLFVTPEVDILREHVLAPGETMESIHVPARAGGAASQFLVIREKQAYDWPLVAASARLEMEGRTVKGCSLALGAVCPVPLRRPAAEKALAGKELNETTAAAAAAAAFEGATPLSQNGYKVQAGTALLRRAILAAGGVR